MASPACHFALCLSFFMRRVLNWFIFVEGGSSDMLSGWTEALEHLYRTLGDCFIACYIFSFLSYFAYALVLCKSVDIYRLLRLNLEQ